MANPYYLDSVMYLKYPPRAVELVCHSYDPFNWKEIVAAVRMKFFRERLKIAPGPV